MHRGCTLMMLTSSEQTTDAIRCRELQVQYLGKPIGQAELLDALLKHFAGAEKPKAARPSPLPGPVISRSILLAEDNVINQKITHRLRATIGHLVVLACNDADALEALHHHES